MFGLSIGEFMLVVTGLATVITQLWGLFGKAKQDSVTYLVGERNRLDARVAELEKAREEDRARLDKVEAELEALRLDHRELLNFLRDIISGRFDHEWVKGRAQDLLDRFGGGS